VAREVGTEGKLGGQADVRGVAGTWKDLTDNVNLMAGNLTNQVRGIALVVTAVANGNLKQKLTVEAKGEIAALADTINGMTDTLAIFADQVTTVAREVGVEGKLGGQASVPGAAGTWRDLTDNVNQLAANLTTQVRAIAEVATAVTKGDLTRSITVKALGEVAALKDNINEMIRNLKDTTLKNSEQDWLKTNLAKFSRMLQGQKDLLTVGELILSELAPVVSAQQGVFYTMDTSNDGDSYLKLLASYAHRGRKDITGDFKLGEGLVGQCALEKEKILLTNPPRNYMTIGSGLGQANPLNLLVLPVVFEGQVKGVIELASFDHFSQTHHAFLDQLTESIGIVLNTIEANTRTEDLLIQSQSLAKELQSQQLELQQTNQQLAEKAKLLADQNVEVERKNREVEQARQALEEKAKQLALTSKYKSEFLANMSHELRTPLNSLLILSDELSKNKDQNLSEKQVEFAKTIHASGTDLLALINDILDLSKIESGTVVVDAGDVNLRDLHDYVERSFRHFADTKKLAFEVRRGLGLPKMMQTDAKRLQQILKNLLSNAFKFTEHGQVSLSIMPVHEGWSSENETLNHAKSVVAFSVHDTGIGISSDKQQIIFEAFQQADGSTSRKYGGTGLGLAISREIARLLGGEIRLVSVPGEGSTFTLFLPQHYVPIKPVKRQALLEAPVPVDDMPLEILPPEEMEAVPLPPPFEDDADNIQPEDRVLLIVENDTSFAQLLLEMSHESGFKALVSTSGADVPALLRHRKIDALTLDINLNDTDGWKVLARVKDDLHSRHLPVYIITTEDGRARGLRMGAVGVLSKPLKSSEELKDVFTTLQNTLQPQTRQMLIAAGDASQRDTLSQLLAGEDVRITEAQTGEEALAKLRDNLFHVVVVDMKLEDLPALALLEEIKKDQHLADIPVLAFTESTLSKKDEAQLKHLGQTMNLKEVRSPERLLDECALFLHRNVEKMPEEKRGVIQRLYEAEAVLKDRKILIVDDDIRNIFAMTSLLERYQMQIISAETGKIALDKLQANPDIQAVLMDIMMPDMDGYDTMRAVRKFARFRTLPMIAVTAKAMKGDREKCIEAGASDYIAKPVDSAELLSLLRLWLHR
jgi:signal transduction histidine kinase/CheY-like chemotaxis protein/HAMP domain-containing protein